MIIIIIVISVVISFVRYLCFFDVQPSLGSTVLSVIAFIVIIILSLKTIIIGPIFFSCAPVQPAQLGPRLVFLFQPFFILTHLFVVK